MMGEISIRSDEMAVFKNGSFAIRLLGAIRETEASVRKIKEKKARCGGAFSDTVSTIHFALGK
jgi:hypothetical protein